MEGFFLGVFILFYLLGGLFVLGWRGQGEGLAGLWQCLFAFCWDLSSPPIFLFWALEPTQSRKLSPLETLVSTQN